jgi:hypothetical protein
LTREIVALEDISILLLKLVIHAHLHAVNVKILQLSALGAKIMQCMWNKQILASKELIHAQ